MNNKKRIWFGFCLVLVLSVALVNSVRAGFGISPPYIRNENLIPGSHFEQKIILVRDIPEEDWRVNLIFNVPGANHWFSVDKGEEFILPKGEKQTPIIISVNVPKSAKLKKYRGFIRVKTTPVEAQEPGTVAITLGGQIDVDLNVTKEIFDFKVKRVKISDLEEGYSRLFWYFPGVIRFSIQLENIGNIKAVPSKVRFDIYDAKQEKLLESIETKRFDRKVEPFRTEWVTARLTTRLKPGSYWARYKIYKKKEVVNQGKVHLSILPKGTISRYQRAGFLDLDLKDKIVMILFFFFVLIGVSYSVYQGFNWWKKKKRV